MSLAGDVSDVVLSAIAARLSALNVVRDVKNHLDVQMYCDSPTPQIIHS